jgi:hypothetical protein
MVDAVIRLVLFLIGFVIVSYTVLSAIRTFILPRSARDPISRAVFLTMRRLFDLRVRGAKSYGERDAIMALYAPISLITLPPVWLICVLLGYMFMFRAVGVPTLRDAFLTSGSSILTLGFASVDTVPKAILAFSAGTIGLILVAVLISYLPTMYSAFSRREAAVNMLDVRAGSPPSAVEMIARYYRIRGLDQLHEIWTTWETWFADIEETHTSLAALPFFRSPQPDRSWITAAGAVLDAAALADSALDIPRDAHSNLCIRAGYLALRRIADFFQIQYNPNPTAVDPISISREEFDSACDQLAAAGVPLKADRDQSWRNFAGWRVNYDTVLLALAGLVMAPYAPWSSDRSFRVRRFAHRKAI